MAGVTDEKNPGVLLNRWYRRKWVIPFHRENKENRIRFPSLDVVFYNYSL